MAGNSTIQLSSVIDDLATFGDLAPVLNTGGYSVIIPLSIANDTMNAILVGGPQSQPFNWKWNRVNVPSFCTISYQQDYFVPGVVNVAWLENCDAVNINQTSNPKQKQILEVKRDLDVTYNQNGYPGKICWLPNDFLQTGTWGAQPLGPTAANSNGTTTIPGINFSGLQNPGPNVIYTNPLGVLNQPVNATTCITDPNGNLWTLTTYGTCGTVQPSWPSTPVFPTYTSPTTVATTVIDGTCVWTAINPKGQGFRLSPIPPQTGVVWLIVPIAQKRIPLFTSLQQTLDPIPDDYALYFKNGMIAQCYRRSPDPKIRARFKDEWALWFDYLDKAVRSGQREEDDMGFFPGSGVMEASGYGGYSPSPALPWGPWLS